MKRWFKVAAPVTALVFVAGITAGHASASPTLQKHPQPAGQRSQPGAAEHAQVITPSALVDTSVESKYTPIAPCRIVDTRLGGGAIANLSARNFHALGSGSFAAQGGTSCDIPFSATAVTGSVISADAPGSGYVKVYGYGAAEPTASFLNYVKTPLLSASGTIPVSDSTFDFTVKAFGKPTQVIIQLTGYYIRPMWVEVASNATYVQGSRVTALSTLGTGLYEVDFDRNITGCAYTANSYTGGISVEVEPRVTNVNGVFLALEDSTGALVNAAFYLTVTC
jgi:hypothetical protein